MAAAQELVYRLDPAAVREPPRGFWATLRQLGPSLIITASVIGSGELIMTTTLGAKAGFAALWVILLSCTLKVALQIEYGRHAISTGETTLEALNRLPGPRWKGASWALWIWLAGKLAQLIQYGGIVGGVALALALAVPAIPVPVWTWLAAISVALLVFRGHYRFIERACVSMVAAFAFFTIYCTVLLERTPYAFHLEQLLEGLRFHIPPGSLGVAVAVFGITGLSADEIMSFPYWCVEKGYARYTGPRVPDEAWVRRARGWMRVMYIDAILSMVVYTLATAAFYVLGAAILSRQNAVPAGYEMIRTISKIYTESFGPSAMVVFLGGAVVVLYSTMFVSCASSSRMFADAFGQWGLLDYRDARSRGKWIAAMAWILPTCWALLFTSFKAPVVMITIGGLAVTFTLALVIVAAYDFRYRRLDPRLAPSRWYDLWLWLSFVSIAAVGARALWEAFRLG